MPRSDGIGVQRSAGECPRAEAYFRILSGRHGHGLTAAFSHTVIGTIFRHRISVVWCDRIYARSRDATARAHAYDMINVRASIRTHALKHEHANEQTMAEPSLTVEIEQKAGS